MEIEPVGFNSGGGRKNCMTMQEEVNLFNDIPEDDGEIIRRHRGRRLPCCSSYTSSIGKNVLDASARTFGSIGLCAASTRKESANVDIRAARSKISRYTAFAIMGDQGVVEYVISEQIRLSGVVSAVNSGGNCRWSYRV